MNLAIVTHSSFKQITSELIILDAKISDLMAEEAIYREKSLL
jgi:hypothetical protein